MSSDTNVIPLPVTFRPHAIAGEAAAENVTPRPFGKRPRRGLDALAGGLGEVLDVACGRSEDRTQQDRIKAAAREARNAFDSRHICPSLIVSIANRVSGLADAAERMAEEAKSLGLLRAATQLREHAGLLEALAAELELEQPEKPA